MYRMTRRKLVGHQDLVDRYPDRRVGGFTPTHHVQLFQVGSNHLVREDFIFLSDPDNKGVRYGYLPGEEEGFYALIPPGRWQCLKQTGIVSAQEVKYRPEYLRPALRKGVVYFIQAGGQGPIKIGWSSDLQARIAQLQTANATKLSVLLAMPGTFEDEARLHARFAYLRLEAEWFQDSPEILSYIEEHRK
jgi:hypothetical protein